MFIRRRLILVTAILITVLIVSFQRSAKIHFIPTQWRSPKGPSAQEIASGEHILPDLRNNRPTPDLHQKSLFPPGTPKPPGENYTRTLVIARTRAENTTWIRSYLGSLIPPEGNMEVAEYVVDQKRGEGLGLEVKKNKGHEVMVYLTYIIDHYPNLADISIFMHAHRFAWHNNELQNNDAAWMLLDLDPSHVVRRGYFNLRCAWDPGCPDWLHPLDPAVPDTVSGSRTSEMGRVALDKAEEPLMAAAFKELFPLDPVPKILSQPCCGQFALSRERIQAIPLARYVYFRDWLLRTELSDYLSGRVWEYLWHYLFTGRTVDCPSMRGCYCSGYGICFGGEMEFEGWFEKRWRVREREYELRRTEQLERLADEELGGQAKERKKGWWAQGKEKGNGKGNKMPGEEAELERLKPGRKEWLVETIEREREELNQLRDEAWRRGRDPAVRVKESGKE